MIIANDFTVLRLIKEGSKREARGGVISPEEQKEIEQHTKAIDKILYTNTPKEELTSLSK